MATTLRSSSSASSLVEINISTKSHHSFIFFVLLLFILVSVVSSSSGEYSSDMPSSSHETLVSDSSADQKSAPKTVDFQPGERAKNSNRHESKSKGKDRQFEASAHEVPSGPNPISN